MASHSLQLFKVVPPHSMENAYPTYTIYNIYRIYRVLSTSVPVQLFNYVSTSAPLMPKVWIHPHH